MIVTDPTRDASVTAMLLALGALQIAETEARVCAHDPGQLLWISLEAGIRLPADRVHRSHFQHLFRTADAAGGIGGNLPGVWSTLLFSLVALGSYLSFLLFVDWSKYYLGPEGIYQLVVNAVFIPMAANVANVLAEEVRVQSGEYKKVAEQLVEANQSLRVAEEAVRRSDRLAALGSSRPDWRTSCGIRWARLRRRPRCWNGAWRGRATWPGR